MIGARPRRPKVTFRSSGATIYGFAVVFALVALAYLTHGGHQQLGQGGARGATLVVVALFWLAVMAGFGVDIHRNPLGVLTSGANRYSLARLQMVFWTWIILSALSAAALCRAFQFGGGDLATAFNIDLDDDLYTVMGVSLFTGAAGPALLALKAQGSVDTVQRDLAAYRMNENVSARGKLAVRPISQPPRFSDLVEGDELSSAGVVDLSKVQQLIITVILAGVYAAMVFDFFLGDAFFTAMSKPSPLVTTTKLPTLNADMVKLLVLSHAGYLGYKAAPKPPAAPAAPSAFAGPPPTPDRKGGFE